MCDIHTSLTFSWSFARFMGRLARAALPCTLFPPPPFFLAAFVLPCVHSVVWSVLWPSAVPVLVIFHWTACVPWVKTIFRASGGCRFVLVRHVSVHFLLGCMNENCCSAVLTAVNCCAHPAPGRQGTFGHPRGMHRTSQWCSMQLLHGACGPEGGCTRTPEVTCDTAL